MMFASEALKTAGASWWRLQLVSWFGDHFTSEDADGRAVHFSRYRGAVYFMGYLDETDTPPLTFDKAVGWVRNALAVVGMLAVAAVIGLWQSGFLGWLMTRYGF